jgi:RHS repeat-associated protein
MKMHFLSASCVLIASFGLLPAQDPVLSPLNEPPGEPQFSIQTAPLSPPPSPTPLNLGSDKPPCGNPPCEDSPCSDGEDGPCGDEKEAEEGTTSSGSGSSGSTDSSPPAPCGSANPIDIYTGNAYRKINDLSLFRGTGAGPLEFKRYSNTRLRSLTANAGPFGKDATWSHSFSYSLRDDGTFDGVVGGRKLLYLSLPDGEGLSFIETAIGSAVYKPSRANQTGSISQAGSTFTLWRGNQASFIFHRKSNTNGTTFLRIASRTDGEGNTVLFQYDDPPTGNPDRLLRRVRDAIDCGFDFTYDNLGYLQGQRTHLRTLTWEDPVDAWVEKTVSPAAGPFTTVFLALAETDWHYTPQAAIAELEFFDQNNVKILPTAAGVTVIGSSQTFDATSTPAKAFDSDTTTAFRYLFKRNGYIGLTFATPRIISKIRWFQKSVTVVGHGNHSAGEFIGLSYNSTPTPHLKQVTATDGRAVIYNYGFKTWSANDPFTYNTLDSVVYPDNTVALYSYQQQHEFTPPRLETMMDPHVEGIGLRIRYEFNPAGVLGQMLHEKSLDTGLTIASVMAEVDAGDVNSSLHRPVLVNANGANFKFSYDNISNTPVRSYDAYGNRSDYTYEMASTGNATVTTASTSSATVTVASVPPGLAVGSIFMGRTVTVISGNTITLNGNANATIATATVRPFNYNPSGYLATRKDPLGRTTTFSNYHAAAGKPQTIVLPDSTTHVKTFDSRGRLLTHKINGPGLLATGLLTTHTREPATGRITRTDHPDGTYETWLYNTYGKTTSRRQRNGGVYTYVWSVAGANPTSYNPAEIRPGLLLSQTDPLGATTNYVYDDLGLVLNTFYPNGSNDTSYHDQNGRLVNFYPATGGYEFTHFDDYGNAIQKSENSLGSSAYSYDEFRRVISQQVLDGGGYLLSSMTYSYGSGVASGGSGCGSCGSSSNSRATGITHPDGRTEARVYDLMGRLLSVTHNPGASQIISERHAYDKLGNRIVSQDADDIKTYFAYDSRNRLYRTCNTVQLKNAAGTAIGVGVEKRLILNGMGQVAIERIYSNAATSPYAGVLQKSRTFTYDAMGRPLKSSDFRGNLTTVSYALNATGWQETITYPPATGLTGNLTRTVSRQLDLLGRPLTETDGAGTAQAGTTQHTYDLNGTFFTTTDSVGKTIYTENFTPAESKTYLSNLDYSATVRYNGRVTQRRQGTDLSVTLTTGYWYNQAGQPLGANWFDQNSNSGILWTRTYDVAGRVATETDGMGQITTRQYDAHGRLWKIIDPLNRTTTYTRNGRGLVTFITAPDGVVTQRAYDEAGRVVKEWDGKNLLTQFNYRYDGVLLSYKDPLNRTISFLYDNDGRRTQRTEPDATYQTYAYDAAGLLITRRKADNIILNYRYDVRHRQVAERLGVSVLASFAWDADNRLTQAINADARTTRTYDTPTGSLATERQEHLGVGGAVLFDKTIIQTYGNGQRQSLSDTAGTLTYQWDGPGRLATLDVDGPPPAFTFGYDMNHRRIQTLTESGITEDRVYDPAGQLTALNVTRTTGGTTLSATGYDYNTAGQRTLLTREDGTGDAFGYDNNRQVTAAHVGGTAGAAIPSTPNRSYIFDSMGNRTSAVKDGVTTGYTPNTVNAYSAVGGISRSHDLNGNLTNDGTKIYTWEQHDLLTTVTVAGTVVGAYRYDAFGRRLSRTWKDPVTTLTRTTRYVYDGWNVVAEHSTAPADPNGPLTLQRRYVWGPDLSGTMQGAGGVGGLLMIEDRTTATPQAHYVCYDGNGNVTKLITQDTSGNPIISAAYTYDPFGNVRTATGPYAATNPVRFSTKFQDPETGWSYYGYRYYDAANGRWTSRDPIEEEGGVNLFSMISNSPVTYFDFLGLAKCCVKGKDKEYNSAKECCKYVGGDVGYVIMKKTECFTTIAVDHNGDARLTALGALGIQHKSGDRCTGVSCFDGDDNSYIPPGSEVPRTHQRFNDRNIPDDWDVPNTGPGPNGEPIPTIPNRNEPGYLWPNQLGAAVELAIKDAMREKDNQCKNNCCLAVTIKVRLSSKGRPNSRDVAMKSPEWPEIKDYVRMTGKRVPCD